MDRLNIDNIIALAMDVNERITTIESEVYSSGTIEDMDAVLEQILHLKRLSEELSSVTRYADEKDLLDELSTQEASISTQLA